MFKKGLTRKITRLEESVALKAGALRIIVVTNTLPRTHIGYAQKTNCGDSDIRKCYRTIRISRLLQKGLDNLEEWLVQSKII